MRELVVGYGRGKTVLHDVSLRFKPGEMAVIMGHNGAGKTTLLNSIFGLLPPERGEILLDGRALGSSPAERVRRGISYSLAGQAILPGLTVGENLDIAAGVVPERGEASRAHRKTVFDLFPILAERRIQRAGSLSGGQRRMLALGMALMQAPRVLLLDEPSLGLSPKLVSDLYDAIYRIRADLGLTVVAVEQNINPTILQADRLHVLRMGRIVISDTSEVLHDPQRLWSLL